MGRPLRHDADAAALASVQGVQLVRLSSVEGEYASYVWNNLVLNLWFGQTTLSGLATFEQNVKPYYERNERGVSGVNIVVPGKFTVPSAEARREFARFAQQYASHTVATAIVIPGAGFMSSAVRGVITALTLASPRSFKMHVFDSTRAAADWLPAIHNERTGVVISADELALLIDSAQLALERAR